eukprot:679009-Prymnesium_polylepis.1
MQTAAEHTMTSGAVFAATCRGVSADQGACGAMDGGAAANSNGTAVHSATGGGGGGGGSGARGRRGRAERSGEIIGTGSCGCTTGEGRVLMAGQCSVRPGSY